MNQDRALMAKEIINRILNVDIDKKTRKQDTLTGRQMYYKWCRDNTTMSYKKIAQTLELKQHHSSVINSLHEFDNYFITEGKYRDL